MISGLGFFEIAVVFLLVLLFFGSKELPFFLKETGRFIGKIRRYSDRVRRELDDVTRLMDSDHQQYHDETADKKKRLRKNCRNACKELSDQQRIEKSLAIAQHLFDTDEFIRAKAVMVYMATPYEVQTDPIIQQLFAAQKKVVIPYCKTVHEEMGIAEIKDIAHDCIEGAYKIKEPRKELHDNFFRSDIQLIICPGVGFDKFGGRLGQGKGYYDKFLKELKDKIPIMGIAYQCQILQDSLPFDYHDVPMDMVITELGPVVSSMKQ